MAARLAGEVVTTQDKTTCTCGMVGCSFGCMQQQRNVALTRTLGALRDAAHGNARDHGFHDVARTVGDGLMLIVTEASEAYESFREGSKPAEFRYEEKVAAYTQSGAPLLDDEGKQVFVALPRRDPFPKKADGTDDVDRPRKPVGVPSELADIIVRVLDFSGEHGIDIERAVLEKMAYNRTRPHKHGGKVL